MIDGHFIDSLAEATEAIEEIEGRQAAYGFAVNELDRQRVNDANRGAWIGIVLFVGGFIVFLIMWGVL